MSSTDIRDHIWESGLILCNYIFAFKININEVISAKFVLDVILNICQNLSEKSCGRDYCLDLEHCCIHLIFLTCQFSALDSEQYVLLFISKPKQQISLICHSTVFTTLSKSSILDHWKDFGEKKEEDVSLIMIYNMYL